MAFVQPRSVVQCTTKYPSDSAWDKMNREACILEAEHELPNGGKRRRTRRGKRGGDKTIMCNGTPTTISDNDYWGYENALGAQMTTLNLNRMTDKDKIEQLKNEIMISPLCQKASATKRYAGRFSPALPPRPTLVGGRRRQSTKKYKKQSGKKSRKSKKSSKRRSRKH